MKTTEARVAEVAEKLLLIGRLARDLPEQSGRIGALLDQLLAEAQGEPPKPPSLADVAHAIMRARHERSELIGSDIFRDPAWDMLLELYHCRSTGREPSISDLCVAANVPATTGLRYIDSMERLGFLSRRRDRRDQRRIIVDADAATMVKVERVLERFARRI